MAGSTSGIIAGMNPLQYSSGSPYTIFFFQLIVILTIAQLLNVPLSKIRQPRVISEVLTGIILSHTALGRIPNFTKYVFPDESIPDLTLVANIGICLLMFIVGCEVDVQFIKKHMVTAISVGLFNMAVPFGLGCACAVGLWKDYREKVEDLPEIKFTTFMVFIAVAMCITAFPVLVRILTELRLVKDRVGTVVLAAGITNDLLGWVLLALSITLANSSQSLVTLYIVLVALGWCIFICYPVRIALDFFLTRILKEFDNPNTPSRLAMTIILMMMFASAFFTDIIGVHPIFGAFIMGCIVPRKNDYVISLTSRIEDLVNIIFIPVYFAVAGLEVDLGLLTQGLDWGWAIGLIAIAMVGKISGGMIAAKLRGLYWRESLTVGVLMSCKGIVEIVVLQVGLNAHIISKKTYAMFIFMAIVTTFLTTPLTIYCYPNSYREQVITWIAEKNKLDVHEKDTSHSESDDANVDIPVTTDVTLEDIKNYKIGKLILTVDDVESLSTGLLVLDLFLENFKIPVHTINLKTLTERTADVLHASMMNERATNHDFNSLNSLLSIFKIFCHYNRIPFSSEIIYSLPENYLDTLFDNSYFRSDDFLVLSITQKQYSIEYITQIISTGKSFNYKKGLFINNTQDIESNCECDDSLQKQVIMEDPIERKEKEAASFLSENTCMNPSSLHVRSVTIYISNGALSENDTMGMRLFDILIRGKDLHSAKVVLNNIDNDSKTGDLINSWVEYNSNSFKNIDISIVNKTNKLGKIETGKSIGTFLAGDNDKHATLDRLVIVSIGEEDDVGIVTELVKGHEKVIVLF